MVMDINLRKLKLKKGEVLINEGEHSSDFYFLKSGVLAIFIGTRRVASIETAGSLIGEMSFFLGERRSATVIALSDVEVEVIPKDQVIEHFAENPDFAVTVAGSLAYRLSETTKKLADLREKEHYLIKLRNYAKKNPKLLSQMEEFDEYMKKRDSVMKDFLNEKSMLSQKILRPVEEGAEFAINNLLGVKPTRKEPYLLEEKHINADAGSIVSMTGDCEGWYALAFPLATALEMASVMTGTRHTELNDEVFSFIMEFNNIVTGQIISRLEGYQFRLSPPTALFSRKALSNMFSAPPPLLVVPFETELGNFLAILNIELIK